MRTSRVPLSSPLAYNTYEEIKEEISKLNLSEKLLLIEDVWDSIAQGNSELPMPEWQKLELDRRYKEYKAGSQSLHDWQSVHEEIRNKYISPPLKNGDD